MTRQQAASKSDPIVFVVTRRVRPGCEAQFEQWVSRIAAAEAVLPGFLGREDIPPQPDGQDTWTHVIRFASLEDQQSWFTADEYKQLIEEVRPLCTEVHRTNPITGFGSWFRTPDDPGHGAVPTWKQTMVVVLSLYPSIYLITWGFTSHVQWPFATKLLVSNIISVSFLSWVALPLVRRCIGWWMPRSEDRPMRV
ncbi:MAG: antibiotic biosynthesis monooxygenase [Phycisphaerales bacterium]|nr:antibiotic biosynthesis monooxygenase [Phycisphaerales bacterium]